MNAKLSTFLISMIVVCATVSIILVILVDGANQYSPQYTNGSLSSFQNKTAVLYNMTQNISTEANAFDTDNGIFDILGSLASQAYLSLKTSFISIDLMNNLVQDSIGTTAGGINMGPAGNILTSSIIAIILVVIIIGVIISLVVKWPV